MFVSFGELCLENLPDGGFTVTTLEADAAGLLLTQTKDLMGCFDFGPVPSDRKAATFSDILSAVQARTGVVLDPDIFFLKSEGLQFPVPLQVLEIMPERPMLCVRFAFSVAPGKSILTDARVAPDSLAFRLVSVAA